MAEKGLSKSFFGQLPEMPWKREDRKDFRNHNQHTGPAPVELRFWMKVIVGEEDECWPWEGAIGGRDGRGHLRVDGKSVHAHRLAWELWNMKPVPEGMNVCHSCDNPRCCNPSHLWIGSRSDNMRDAVEKGRLSRKGEKNGRSFLTEADIAEIRRLALLDVPRKFLARMWKLREGHVHDIVTGRIWT